MTVGSVTAEIARRICDEQNVGYSQGEDRRTWYAAADAHGRVSSPQSADCSSLAAGAVSYGLHHTYGVPWGHKALLEINDFWTGNLRAGLEARGFEEVNWSDEAMTPDGGFRVTSSCPRRMRAASATSSSSSRTVMTRWSRRRGSLRPATSMVPPATRPARRPALPDTASTRTLSVARGRPATASARASFSSSGPSSRRGSRPPSRPPLLSPRHRRTRTALTSPVTRAGSISPQSGLISSSSR